MSYQVCELFRKWYGIRYLYPPRLHSSCAARLCGRLHDNEAPYCTRWSQWAKPSTWSKLEELVQGYMCDCLRGIGALSAITPEDRSSGGPVLQRASPQGDRSSRGFVLQRAGPPEDRCSKGPVLRRTGPPECESSGRRVLRRNTPPKDPPEILPNPRSKSHVWFSHSDS